MEHVLPDTHYAGLRPILASLSSAGYILEDLVTNENHVSFDVYQPRPPIFKIKRKPAFAGTIYVPREVSDGALTGDKLGPLRLRAVPLAFDRISTLLRFTLNELPTHLRPILDARASKHF